MYTSYDTKEKVFGLPKSLIGNQVWYGKDMKKRTDWIHTLSDSDILEIEAAMDRLNDVKIVEIKQDDFPLTNLRNKLCRIKDEVIDGRGFALLKGLPVERWNSRQSAVAFFGLGTYFGNARSQNAKGHVLGHVRDLGRDVINDNTARTYQTRERQTFHTDSCDIVSLLCLKTAKVGGQSALVSSMTIYNEMFNRRPDLLRLLFEPIPTDRRGEIPFGKKPYFEIPVFNFYQNYLSAIYSRRYIDSAQRFDEVVKLSHLQRDALNLFDELANDPEINMKMEFQPGDMQLVHNHTMLHDRMAYEDWPQENKKRHLLRLWLAASGARPLPDIYSERYGQVKIGDRGGIIVPGARLNAPLEPL